MKVDRLKSFIGKWKTTGEIFESPFGKAGILSGTDSYAFGPNGDFIVHSVNVRMAGKPVKNSEIISYDSKTKAFAMYGFEGGRTAGVLHGKLKGKTWSVRSRLIRFEGKVSKNGRKIIGQWFYKAGSKWKVWMDIELDKIGSGT